MKIEIFFVFKNRYVKKSEKKVSGKIFPQPLVKESLLFNWIKKKYENGRYKMAVIIKYLNPLKFFFIKKYSPSRKNSGMVR